jgi:diphosphomevalonate decarboxylase
MSNISASAIAHPNIALIKYWGNRDHELRIPENGSISFNLDGLYTKTKVTFDPSIENDFLEINGQSIGNSELKRVSQFLRLVNEISGKHYFAKVASENNFPIAAGIASSAAAFAALSLAATKAIGLDLSEKELSRLARRGSGSACRSIPDGFVEWKPGRTDEDSFAVSIAPSSHWDLIDVIAVVKGKHKSVGSTAGHALAHTSPIQKARVADAPRRLDIGRNAILKKDFSALAEIVEVDSNLMHAVMMTSNPSLIYWEPATVTIMKTIPELRQAGLPACYTLDAGPNVHVIVESKYVKKIEETLKELAGIEKILIARVGGPAKAIKE